LYQSAIVAGTDANVGRAQLIDQEQIARK